MSFWRVVLAELDKLRTLPITVLALTGTAGVAILIAAAQVGSAVRVDVVPYVQAGLVLIGIVPVTHEYGGRQLHTSLTAVPARGLLVMGKTVAALIVVAATAVATTTAAAITHYVLADAAVDIGRLAGTAAYLTLIGLLAHAVALLLHHLVAALVTVLCLVVVLSPILAHVTDYARWLPDRAAAQLYDPTDAVLTATTGTLVTLAWLALIGALGARQFVRGDS